MSEMIEFTLTERQARLIREARVPVNLQPPRVQASIHPADVPDVVERLIYLSAFMKEHEGFPRLAHTIAAAAEAAERDD